MRKLQVILDTLEKEQPYVEGSMLESKYSDAATALQIMISDLVEFDKKMADFLSDYNDLASIIEESEKTIEKASELVKNQAGEEALNNFSFDDNSTFEEFRFSPSQLNIKRVQMEMEQVGASVSLESAKLAIGSALVSLQIIRKVFPEDDLNLKWENLGGMVRTIGIDLIKRLPIMGEVVSLIDLIYSTFKNPKIAALRDVTARLKQLELVFSLKEVFDRFVGSENQKMQVEAKRVGKAVSKLTRETKVFSDYVSEYEEFNFQ